MSVMLRTLHQILLGSRHEKRPDGREVQEATRKGVELFPKFRSKHLGSGHLYEDLGCILFDNIKVGFTSIRVVVC
jgi:hypothetical protein